MSTYPNLMEPGVGDGVSETVQLVSGLPAGSDIRISAGPKTAGQKFISKFVAADGSTPNAPWPLCLTCEDNRRAEGYCRDCRNWYCSFCFEAHLEDCTGRQVPLPEEDGGRAQQGESLPSEQFWPKSGLRVRCLALSTP